MITVEELLADLSQYGHYTAVQHVQNSLKRLESRVVRHSTNAETATDAERSVEEAPSRVAVSGVRG